MSIDILRRFLKNKLLDNLNKYFGEESGALEILSNEDPSPEGRLYRNLNLP